MLDPSLSWFTCGHLGTKVTAVTIYRCLNVVRIFALVASDKKSWPIFSCNWVNIRDFAGPVGKMAEYGWTFGPLWTLPRLERKVNTALLWFILCHIIDVNVSNLWLPTVSVAVREMDHKNVTKIRVWGGSPSDMRPSEPEATPRDSSWVATGQQKAFTSLASHLPIMLT